MPRHTKLTFGLAVLCILAMLLFNHLATKNPLAKDAYLEYAKYLFECFKVLIGMVIGSLASMYHHRREVQNYKQTIQQLSQPQPPKSDTP